MRLALMIEGQEDVTWDQWRALAGACEEHGVEALFRSDHYLSVEGKAERGSLDAWATLAALAAVTSTVELGTLVSPATFRHPSELAKAVATVDHVSGGRVTLGLGAGWNEREHAAYGFPFPPTGERMEILEEQLEIVTRAWADGPFSFEGRHYRIDDLDARPKPLQRPRPHLIMGGQARPRGLALAARYADEYNLVYRTAAECEEIRGRVDDRLTLSLMTGVLVGEDRAELLDRAGRLAEWRRHQGDAESFVEALPDAWIVGTLDEAAEQLRALEAVGVERVMLQHLSHWDVGPVEQIGRVLAPAVA
jgi:F420-dependent oxidoreductase-like protein